MDKNIAGLTIENAFSGLELGPAFEEARDFLLQEMVGKEKLVLKLCKLAQENFIRQRSGKFSDAKVDKVTTDCYDLLYDLGIEIG